MKNTETKKITKKDIVIILSNHKYWCPSKKEQWSRTADAIIEFLKTKGLQVDEYLAQKNCGTYKKNSKAIYSYKGYKYVTTDKWGIDRRGGKNDSK